MFALFLKEELPFGTSPNHMQTAEDMSIFDEFSKNRRGKYDKDKAAQQAFIRALMFDKFFKCNMMMLEETWRSRDLLNREKINRLVRDLNDQKDRFEKYQESMDLTISGLNKEYAKKLAINESKFDGMRRDL